MNGSTSNQENWKIFRRDTKAGRLLSKLYGESPRDNFSRVSYPKLKVRKDSSDLASRPKFSTCVRNEVDPDVVKRKLKVAALNIPKIGRNKENQRSNLSSLPRLRSFAMCQIEIDQSRKLTKAYRPPNSKNLNDEKTKLFEAFELNGGKALPVMPYFVRESELGTENQENLEQVELSIVKQIVSEIEERRNFQKKMEESGVGMHSRERICVEITKRMEELMMHDKHLALEMMKQS